MYRINNRQEAVREIKKYLYVIATRAYPEIGRTTIDSQYDEETKESIKKFQRIMGLEENGDVDLETFNALYESYRRVRYDFYARDYIIEETNFPIGPENSGENVRALHILINELAKEHSAVENVGTGAFYSPRTARAIRELQHTYGLPETEVVDKTTLSIMLMELEAIRRRDKNPNRMI